MSDLDNADVAALNQKLQEAAIALHGIFGDQKFVVVLSGGKMGLPSVVSNTDHPHDQGTILINLLEHMGLHPAQTGVSVAKTYIANESNAIN